MTIELRLSADDLRSIQQTLKEKHDIKLTLKAIEKVCATWLQVLNDGIELRLPSKDKVTD